MPKQIALCFYKEALAGLHFALNDRDTVGLLIPFKIMYREYQTNAAQWLHLCEYWRTCYLNG